MEHHPTLRSTGRAVVLGILLAAAAPAAASAARPGRERRPAPKLSDEARDRGRSRGAAGLDVIVRFRAEPGARESSAITRFGGRISRRHGSRWMSVRVPG